MASGTVQEASERNKESAKGVEKFDFESWKKGFLDASRELQQHSEEERMAMFDDLLSLFKYPQSISGKGIDVSMLFLLSVAFFGLKGADIVREKLPLKVRQAEFQRLNNNKDYPPERVSLYKKILFGDAIAQ